MISRASWCFAVLKICDCVFGDKMRSMLDKADERVPHAI